VGDETKGVAAIIAARSAHELGRFSEREQFLDHAKGAEPGSTRRASRRSPTSSSRRAAMKRRSRC
jgi:uncharacterized protein HemY